MARMMRHFGLLFLAVLVTLPAWAQTAPANPSNRPKLEWEKRVPFDYPAEAKAKGIEGSVVLEVSIDEQGAVNDVQVISGPAELVPSAIAAVKQWKAKPYVVDGKATPLKIKLPLKFSLTNQMLELPREEAEHRLVKPVRPEYPPLARQAHSEGEVILRALIGTDGKVKEVEVVSGPPLLRQSAIDAVKQWEYKPAEVNGQPREFQTTISVKYWMQ